jgi:N-acetyl-gamma-glutamyl-phosphate reductase
MFKVSILGGTGYTAGELLRILLFHPKIQIQDVVSRSKSGELIYLTHQDLLGEKNLYFTKELNKDIDLVFICISHGYSRNYIEKIPKNIIIIDLTQDCRLKNCSVFKNRYFTYGLPELYSEKIRNSKYISNPGCFATVIQLSLLPLAKYKLIDNDIHISAITGSTGSGNKLSPENNFSTRYNNISNYKLLIHQHIEEVYESILLLQNKLTKQIYFIPYRGNFTRGIISTIYTKCNININELKYLYKNYYKKSKFIWLSDRPINLKEIVNTNKCFIYIVKKKDNIIISAVLDNMIKGASGQAIQNLNILNDWDESCGLIHKSIVF